MRDKYQQIEYEAFCDMIDDKEYVNPYELSTKEHMHYISGWNFACRETNQLSKLKIKSRDWPTEVGFYWIKHKFDSSEPEFKIGVCEVLQTTKDNCSSLIYLLNGHFIYKHESEVIWGDQIEPTGF